MNNLEWLKRKNVKKYDNVTYAFCKVLYQIENEEPCFNKQLCDHCKFNTFRDIIQYLSEEHKEKIKLKKWEYDILIYHKRDTRFNDNHFLMIMRSKGYFNGIDGVDVASMKIRDILDNCEIVSDDYEGFEECK